MVFSQFGPVHPNWWRKSWVGLWLYLGMFLHMRPQLSYLGMILRPGAYREGAQVSYACMEGRTHAWMGSMRAKRTRLHSYLQTGRESK